MEEEYHNYWERIYGYASENDIDARWILRSTDPNDNRAHGSLRIVSHPDLKPGYLRAHWSVVTSRRPKTQKEIEQALEDYQMEIHELEIYSVDEHVTTNDVLHEDRKQSIEEMFGVKIFE